MSDIDSLRRETRQQDVFAMPSGQELAATRNVFEAMMADRLPTSQDLDAAMLELRVGRDFTATVDTQAAPAGRGLYVLRRDGLPLLFSAPHQFKDLDTGLLAALMTEEQGALGVAFNTAPRDLPIAGGGGLSDLGKLDATHFNAFHLAFRAAYPAARIVQLHGFARDKRRSEAGRAADVIVSNGTRRADPGAIALADCLRRAGFGARLYPNEVRELGGTRSATLAALMGDGAPAGTFLHIEISRELRDTLIDNQDVRWVFGACLGARL